MNKNQDKCSFPLKILHLSWFFGGGDQKMFSLFTVVRTSNGLGCVTTSYIYIREK